MATRLFGYPDAARRSRRDFLRRAALGAGVIATGGFDLRRPRRPGVRA